MSPFRRLVEGYLTASAFLLSVAEEPFEIAAAMHDSKDQRVAALNAVNDDVFADCQAAAPESKICIARASNIGETAERGTTICDGVDQAAISMLPLSLAT